MDALTETMLDRVRRLLALAEDDGATEAEALLATTRAAEIMAKYSIDAAMLAAKADMREVPCDKVITFEQPYAKQHVWFYCAILRAFRGDAVIIQQPTRGRAKNIDVYQLRVYAFEADLMAVDILYTSLLLQAANQLKSPPKYEHAKTWKVSFWAGFTSVISTRLQQANETATDSTKVAGTDIVLRDRSLAVKAKKELDYPKLRIIRSSGYRSNAGYNSGKEAGERANLYDKKAAGQGTRTALR